MFVDDHRFERVLRSHHLNPLLPTTMMRKTAIEVSFLQFTLLDLLLPLLV